MKVVQASKPDATVDVVCDVCGMCARDGEAELHHGTMHASWGKGSVHCGEEYELHLCERCIFSQIAEMKRARWLAVMFDEEGDAILSDDAYGRVTKSAKEGGGELC